MPEQATEPGVVGRGHLQKSLKGRRKTMVSLGGVIEAGLFVGGWRS
jgi:amino acid permease